MSVVCDNIVPQTERIRQEMEQRRRPKVVDSPYLRRKPIHKSIEAICTRFGDWVPPECNWASVSRSADFFKGCRLFSETEAEEKKILACSQKPFDEFDEDGGYVSMTTLGANCKFNQLRDAILTERITKNHYLQGRPDSAQAEDAGEVQQQFVAAQNGVLVQSDDDSIEKPPLLPVNESRVSGYYRTSKWKQPITSAYDQHGRPKKVELPLLNTSHAKTMSSFSGGPVSTARRRVKEAEQGTRKSLGIDGDRSNELQLPALKDTMKSAKAKETIAKQDKNITNAQQAFSTSGSLTARDQKQFLKSNTGSASKGRRGSNGRPGSESTDLDLLVGAGDLSKACGRSSGNGQLRAFTFRKSITSGFKVAPATGAISHNAPNAFALSCEEAEEAPPPTESGLIQPPKREGQRRGLAAMHPRPARRRACDVTVQGITETRLMPITPIIPMITN